ncbi:sacsin-beta sandwich [Caudoviricetes sp.]|nr:sacsin-beta sandwich [Caudoviricetes sp.]
MNSIIQTNILKTYVPDWTIEHALRELLQNAIDQGEYTIDYSHGILTIATRSQLTIKDLFLGYSSKRNDNTKIGQHGEGLKLALLVLARESRKPVIITDTLTIQPSFTSEIDILQFEVVERPLTKQSNMTLIDCLISQEEYDLFCNINLPKDSDTGPILDSNNNSKLYIGGLFVGETTYFYSYNFAPEQLKLERDRRVADMNDLEEAIANEWLQHEDKLELIVEGIKEGLSDFNGLRYIEIPYWLQEAVDKETPPNARSMMQQWSKVGGTTISDVHYSIYSRSTMYKKPVYPLSPAKLVENWAYDNRRFISHKGKHKVAELIQEAKKWQLA